MQFLAAAAQMKELDRIAIEERGVPSLTLMEHAAQAVAEAVMDQIEPLRRRGSDGPSAVISTRRGREESTGEEQRQMERLRSVLESKNGDPTPRVAVFCGPGNNGGDGLAAARLLRERGCEARVFLIGNREKMTGDAAAMASLWECAGGTIEPFRLNPDHPEAMDGETQLQLAWLSTCDCLVDAIFGVGLSRPVEGLYRSAIQYLNQAMRHIPVVACDIPSGIHADTGEAMGEAVNAAVTVTFTCGKPGLYLGEGAVRAGQVREVDIGIPFDLVCEKVIRAPGAVRTMAAEDWRLPRRPRNAHKGAFGRVLILAGSVGYTGAPALAAEAAVRSGAGLVYLGVPREIWPVAAVKCNEAMPFPLPDRYEDLLERARGCGAVLIGPGLGRAPETETLVLRLLADLDTPVVLDADGLNALAGHLEVLDRRTAPTVLTPHDGEFARLTGHPLPIHNRLEAARAFAGTHGCVLVLKGHRTVTAGPDGGVYINTTGNPGMARGGAGDALAGLLTGFWGQKLLRARGMDLTELTAQAVCCHGQAGDLAAAERGEYGMTIGDLMANIPAVLRAHTENP